MNGRVESRFEISHPEYGVIDYKRTKREAFIKAKMTLHWKLWDYDFVEVYDSMARVGQEQLWRLAKNFHAYKIVKVERREDTE